LIARRVGRNNNELAATPIIAPLDAISEPLVPTQCLVAKTAQGSTANNGTQLSTVHLSERPMAAFCSGVMGDRRTPSDLRDNHFI
jgi:hypothetical protein